MCEVRCKGGLGACPPRKILDFRRAEIDSGAVSGQISYGVDDPSSYNALLSGPFWPVRGFERTPPLAKKVRSAQPRSIKSAL